MKLRVAKKVWREEHEFRSPGEAGWGFYRKLTLARAWRRLNLKARAVARTIEFEVMSPDAMDGLLAGIRPLEHWHPNLVADDTEQRRNMEALRQAMSRMDAKGEVLVLPAGDFTIIDLRGGTLTPEVLDQAARSILERHPPRPYSISGTVAAPGDPEKP